MSTQNTKIRTSYFEGGIKLPFESPSTGDNYAASGPVTTYKLSPEELARYGPAQKSARQTVYKFKNPHQREAEELANRLDRLRKALNKGIYLAKKADGMSDAEICTWAVGEAWRDAMPELKKEWGLETKTVAKPEVEAVPSVMTVDMERLNPKTESGIIQVVLPEMPLKKSSTAFDLADEFYRLQEENNDISNQIGEMVHAAEINTRRMDKIREALEGVKVAI